MTLLPPNATLLERATAQVLSAAQDLPVPIDSLWNPDTCPAAVLPWLAWAFHVDGWDDSATERQQRDAIKMSVLLHRKKGTPWAVKRALATLGLDIDLIDQQAQQSIYAEHAPNRLDGTWQLDGTRQIKPLSLVTGIPHIQHWAQFIVRLNLADASNPAILAKLRALVDEWKPARSWPIFAYWLRIYFSITIGVRGRFALQKRVLVPIWPSLYISPRPELHWKTGTDGHYVQLDGTRTLDGSWQVGVRYGAAPGPALRNVRVRSTARMTARAALRMRPVQRLVPLRTTMTPAPTKLGYVSRKLDGSWQIGTSTRLDGSWQIDGTRAIAPHPLTLAPRLGEFQIRLPSHPIPDPNQSGRLVLDGTWQVGGAAQPESRIIITRT